MAVRTTGLRGTVWRDGEQVGEVLEVERVGARQHAALVVLALLRDRTGEWVGEAEMYDLVGGVGRALYDIGREGIRIESSWDRMCHRLP